MKKEVIIQKIGNCCQVISNHAQVFLKDDRGQAMTEYSLLLAITVPLCAWLWHPDNNFFNGMRRLYRRITFVLMYPGP